MQAEDSFPSTPGVRGESAEFVKWKHGFNITSRIGATRVGAAGVTSETDFNDASTISVAFTGNILRSLIPALNRVRISLIVSFLAGRQLLFACNINSDTMMI